MNKNNNNKQTTAPHNQWYKLLTLQQLWLYSCQLIQQTVGAEQPRYMIVHRPFLRVWLCQTKFQVGGRETNHLTIRVLTLPPPPPPPPQHFHLLTPLQCTNVQNDHRWCDTYDLYRNIKEHLKASLCKHKQITMQI